MIEPIDVEAEPTPNPNAMKFTLNRRVTEGRGQTFDSVAEAAASPLAQQLFAIDGVHTLFFLKDFITVGRAPEADWDAIMPRVEAAIHSYYEAHG